MDKPNKHYTKETDSPNETKKAEYKAKYSDILTFENASNTKNLSSKDITPNLKERKDSDSHLKKNESLHETTIQETSKERISQDNDVLSENQKTQATFLPKFKSIRKGKKRKPKKRHEEVGMVKSVQSKSSSGETAEDISKEDADNSSKKKVTYFRKTLSKYLRRTVTNPMGTMRNIIFSRNKGKMPKSYKFRSSNNDSNQVKLIQIKLDNSEQISKEKDVSVLKLEALEDSKTKRKPDTFAKIEMQPETSTKSQDAILPLPSTSSASTSASEMQTDSDSEMQNDSDTRTQSLNKPAQQVLGHFKQFLQSSENSVDRFKSDEDEDYKGDLELFLETEIQPSDELTETLIELGCQDVEHSAKSISNLEIRDLEDVTEEGTESAMIEDSRIANSEVSETRIDKSKNLIKTTINIPRERIVYDEWIEYIRGWLIQQAKDKGEVLKLKIKEGKYSDDFETKMRCIEEAEDIQEMTDELFDELDDYSKMENSPKEFDYKDYYSISPIPRKRGLNSPELQVRCLLDLFNYLYKFSNSEAKINSVYIRIYRAVFRMDYDIYLGTKEKQDEESAEIERKGINKVDKFYITLMKCRSKMIKEIPYTNTGSSEDYMNYVQNLIIAANENLTCLETLIPKVSKLIIPLHTYISQAHKKFVMTFSFLKEERSDVFWC